MTRDFVPEPTRRLFKDEVWDKEGIDFIAKIVIAIQPMNLRYFKDFHEEENGYPTCKLRHQDFFERDCITGDIVLDVILIELIAQFIVAGSVVQE